MESSQFSNEPYNLAAVLEESAALLIVDMQNDFVHDEGAFSKSGSRVAQYQALIAPIQRLRRVAREGMIPVWLLGMSHNDSNDGNDAWMKRRKGRGHPDTCRTGEWGQLFHEDVQPEAGDHVLWKHRYSAFTGTTLEEDLHCAGIRTLVFAGLNTNTCVECTVREAHLLGFHVVVIRDATACQYEDAYEPSLINIERHFGIVTTSNELITYWKGK